MGQFPRIPNQAPLATAALLPLVIAPSGHQQMLLTWKFVQLTLVIVVPAWTAPGSLSLKNARLFGNLTLMPISPWSILLPPTGSCTPTISFVTLTTARLVQHQRNTISLGQGTNVSRVWKRTVTNRRGR